MARSSQPRVSTPTNVLDRLPPEEREVLVLSSFYGMAQDEIASVLGAPVAFASTLLERAQNHLRLLLTRVPETRAA